MKNSNAQKIKPKNYFAGILMIIPLLIAIILLIGISDNRSIMSLVLIVVPVFFAFYVLPLFKYSKTIKNYKYANLIRLSFAVQLILSFTLVISGYYILVLTKPLSKVTYWLFLISLGSIVLLDTIRAASDSVLIKSSKNKKIKEGLIKNFLSLKPFVIVFLIIFISPYFESHSSFNLSLIATPIEAEAFKVLVEPKGYKQADKPIKDELLINEIFEQLKAQSVNNIRGISRFEYERMVNENQPKYYLSPQYSQSETGHKIQYIVVLNNGFAAIEESRRSASFLQSDTILYTIQLEDQTIEKIISQINSNIKD